MRILAKSLVNAMLKSCEIVRLSNYLHVNKYFSHGKTIGFVMRW